MAKKKRRSRRTWSQTGNRVRANKPFRVNVKPSHVAIGAGVTLLGVYLVYDYGYSGGEMNEHSKKPGASMPTAATEAEAEAMGAVHRRMGGRGRGAGRGISSTLGGRAPDNPYSHDSPSSAYLNWQRMP